MNRKEQIDHLVDCGVKKPYASIAVDGYARMSAADQAKFRADAEKFTATVQAALAEKATSRKA